MKPMGETTFATVQYTAVFVACLFKRYKQGNTNGFDGTSLWRQSWKAA